MARSVEKYWYAIGFYHAKTKEYDPPHKEEVDYIKSITKVDILEEYEKGHKSGKRD
jgi:hypothetical protein